jgi:GNAT superfamily N-acetyltransferase
MTLQNAISITVKARPLGRFIPEILLLNWRNIAIALVGPAESANRRRKPCAIWLQQSDCPAESKGAFRRRLLPVTDVESIHIRLLEEGDPPSIAAAFQNMGWNKPEGQYRRYLHEQVAGTRTCFVATIDGQFAGYVTVNWQPTYAGFADLNIPEIQDLNVLAKFRRRRIASRLLDRAEEAAARHSAVVGIGVGLHPGYNAAQQLYVKRGYLPDGRGITYRDHFVDEGAQVRLDDDLVMHFTKQLSAEG